MMSCMSFIMMLIIMIIIPTILYIFFFLINYTPNPFEFLSRNPRDVENMNNARRSNKILDEEDYDDDDSKIKDKNNIELVIASSLNMGKDGECPICLACFVQGEELRQLKLCKHLFHRRCIDKWLSTSCNCPVCRDFVGNHIKEKQHNNSNNHNNNFVVASRDDLWQGLPDSAGLV